MRCTGTPTRSSGSTHDRPTGCSRSDSAKATARRSSGRGSASMSASRSTTRQWRTRSDRYPHPSSTFLAYDGETLAFDDSSFDLVISFQVLEHVREPDRFLGEARRVAGEGGVVLIVTPNRNHRLADGERPWNRYHVREFSPSELEAVMRRSFAEVEIFGIQGSAAMNEIERDRVARARKLARLDPLGLRYRLPESIDTKLRVALRRRSGSGAEQTADEVDVEHMQHGADTASSLDLLAVGHG